MCSIMYAEINHHCKTMAATHNLHFLSFLFFFHFILPAIAHETNSSDGGTVRCIESEKQALLELKTSLVDYHNQLSSWGSKEKDCCKWDRVRCHKETGHVRVLNLRPAIKFDIGDAYFFDSAGANLYTSFQPGELKNVAFGGKINSSLVELQHLKHLDLSLYGGTFDPNLIGSLKELRYLNLSRCHLRGSIPNQFGNLSKLVSLDLSHNDFQNIDSLAWLSQLPQLKYLDMSYVDLSRTTSNWLQAINSLPSLHSLILDQCKLSMPSTPLASSQVNSSTSLAVVRLFYNNLTSTIFHWISNFNNSLIHLNLQGNKLKGPIPDALGRMAFLKNLNLGSNQLEGEIPRSLERLSRLEILYLFYNNLTGEFPNLKNLSSLVEIHLFTNKVHGSLPESVSQLSNLEVLDICSNNMSGVVSHIDLSNLTKLNFLCFSDNSFTINFSPEWIPPFQLEVLGMRSCTLGTRFPQWLQTQHRLLDIDISHTGISDVIGSWFWELPFKLLYLDLSGNNISGEIHNLSSILDDFSTVDLSYNNFHGRIPLLPPNVTQLNLSKNMLSGTATNLCSITGGELTYLDLSSNFLSGELPDCWNHWKRLSVISLANNNFSGSIPPSFGSLLDIQTLHLRNNSFTGELPPSLGNCTQMELLDVGENQLTGQIPEWIGKSLSSLIILRLRSNHFHGAVPLHICHLGFIQILDISNNNISGSIPDCLRNFTAMAIKGGEVKTFVHNVSHPIGTGQFFVVPYVDIIQVVWKGMEMEYGRTLGLVKSLDLSCNNFNGDIPTEITSLLGLVALNLSYNQLSGTIPHGIGALESLQSLDLSENHLSGGLPEGLRDLNYLSHLNMSYNNLSGKIPKSTQLQSFDETSFRGNAKLCGQPLPDCPEDDGGHELPTKDFAQNDEHDEIFGQGFYVSIGVGFAVGFWGIGLSFLLHRPWRHAYFSFLDHIGDKLYVAVVLNFTKSKRRICN